MHLPHCVAPGLASERWQHRQHIRSHLARRRGFAAGNNKDAWGKMRSPSACFVTACTERDHTKVAHYIFVSELCCDFDVLSVGQPPRTHNNAGVLRTAPNASFPLSNWKVLCRSSTNSCCWLTSTLQSRNEHFLRPSCFAGCHHIIPGPLVP